jgi:hypothetical protein
VAGATPTSSAYSALARSPLYRSLLRAARTRKGCGRDAPVWGPDRIRAKGDRRRTDEGLPGFVVSLSANPGDANRWDRGPVSSSRY